MKRLKTLMLACIALCGICNPVSLWATETNVTVANFATEYENAADGDVLLLAAGTYGGTINFPNAKTVTLRAAEGAAVNFGTLIRDNASSTTGGGLILEGLNIVTTNAYYIDLSNYQDIKTLTVRDCEITTIGRCFLRTNKEGGEIDEIVFERCLIHDMGSGGWCFMYPKHIVKKVTVTGSTLYNYTGGESLFQANATETENEFAFTFTNNTVYRWSKATKYALCKTDNRYSTNSTYTLRDNIIWRPGVDGQQPGLVTATGGTLTAENNLVVDYGTYNMSGQATKNISDLTLQSLGLESIGFPNPDDGDFTIVSSSPLATASTTGGILGDPRWLKSVTNAVTLSTICSPAEGGTASPVAAILNEGDEATATAKANYGYRFQHWQDSEGNIVSTLNPYTFTVSETMQLTAAFRALDLYTLTVNKEGEGAQWGRVVITPEPVNGKYETGTEVQMTVVPNVVTSFLGWDDGTTELKRTLTMDGDQTYATTFDVIPFVVAWDFYNGDPRNNRPADYYTADSNKGLLKLYNADGSTVNWGASNKNFAGEEHNCLRRYTGADAINNPRYVVATFNVEGYTNVRVNSLGAADNACVHTVQKMQYSTDGSNWTDLTNVTLEQQNKWYAINATLPEGLSDVYVRWIGDAESPLFGTPSATDTEGFYLADIVVYADQPISGDTEAPTLTASKPEAGSNTAPVIGNLVLTFNEQVKAGEGSVVLNGETLTGTFGSRTATFPYRRLEYSTEYTATIPAGAITDMSGNAYAGTTITFTTMERPRPAKRLFDAIVAADGTGNYTSIQAAVDAMPEGRTKPWLVFVKKGTYDEAVLVPKTKTYLHLIGEDRDETQIEAWVNAAEASDPYSSSNPDNPAFGHGAVFQVEANDFYSENITYVNGYGYTVQNGPMALAILSTGDREAWYNCQAISYQDTWFTAVSSVANRHYIKDCILEGAVDYLYGGGDVYLENSTFRNARRGSMMTAPSHNPGTKWGYVMQHCTVSGVRAGVEGNHGLGRPWHNAPICIWLNTTCEATISDTGWNNFGTLPKRMAEYNTRDAQGNLVDTSKRRTTFEITNDAGEKVYGENNPVLTDEEAAVYTYENVVKGTDDWNPREYYERVTAPQGVSYDKDNRTLSWEDDEYAVCYLVYDTDEGELVTITTESSITLPEGTYAVKTVGEYGSLSKAVEAGTTTAINGVNTSAAASIYYNAQGIGSSKPWKGVNIVRQQMSDGTVKSMKKVNK